MTFIGDFFILNSRPSHFIFYAESLIKAFALTKDFLFNVIFEKYPGALSEMKGFSYKRYY